MVSDTVSGSSATLSSSVSAPAQSMVSATPGTLNSSSSRSFWMNAHHLGREPAVGLGHLAPHDLQLARGIGIVDPMIEAAPLQRVVDLARAVGGDDDDRRLFGLDGAELRHRHLEVGQDLEQERLERLVGAVELVDQEHRGRARLAGQRLEHRAADQVFFGEDILAPWRRDRPCRPPPPCGSRSSARHSSTHRRQMRHQVLHSIAAGSAGGRARWPAPWRSRSCRRPPRPRGTAAGACAG